MSEECLHEVNYDERPGFRSALLLNMSQYKPNLKTPKQIGIMDSVESLRLSIESITPRTTPKGTAKIKKESNFKFCLSKDLLHKLEGNSPFVYGEKLASSDFYIQDFEIEKGNENNDEQPIIYWDKSTVFGNFKDFYPSDFNDKLIVPANYQNDDNSYNNDVKDNQFKNQQLNGNSNQNMVNTTVNFQSSFNIKSGNSHFTYFNTMKENFNQNNLDGRRENTFNKSNRVPLFNSPYNYDHLNLIKNSNGEEPTLFSVNMYGKDGWICYFCKNFNYQIRVKCNRCCKPKADVQNQNINELVSNCKNITVNNNLETKENLAPIDSSNVGPRNKTQNNITNLSSVKKKKPFVERVGDWNCFKCKNLNFSFRVSCNRCQLSKKDSEKMSPQPIMNILINYSEEVPKVGVPSQSTLPKK